MLQIRVYWLPWENKLIMTANFVIKAYIYEKAPYTLIIIYFF